jgi:UDP-N-acetyl-D-mannosaminuronic acid dehydrogenase
MELTKEKDYEKILIDKIRERESRLVVIGAGYVGLPTVALFAEAGFPSLVLDVKPEIINRLNQGCIVTNEPGLYDLVCRNIQKGRLKAYLNHQLDLKQIDIIMIAVQTPINENKEPCLQYLLGVLDTIGKMLTPGLLVVLISTVPPRTILNEVKPRLESLSGLKCEKEFYISYVPERIAPGKALAEFAEGTRLIGGVGKKSTRVTAELFKTICKKIIETDATTAEVAKLAENTYRDVNIAFANELALLCEQLGVDVTSTIRLANTHPRVAIHTPGPGVGGPCLPKDPYFLIASSALPYGVVKAARQMNDYMFEHVVLLIVRALGHAGKEISGSKIAILGVAYKCDTDDSRLSPASSIIANLLDLGAEVNVYDSWCTESFGAQKKTSFPEAVQGADCLVTITNHTEFSKLNLQEIKSLMNSKPAIIDGRRIINPAEAKKLGFNYYAIGFGPSNDSLTC